MFRMILALAACLVPGLAVAQFDPLAPPGAAPAPAAAAAASALPNPDSPKPCRIGSGPYHPAAGARPADYPWEQLWPVNAGCETTELSGLRFGAELEMDHRAFIKSAEVPCDDCEGGQHLGDRGYNFLPGVTYESFYDRLGGLKMGQSLSWKVGRELVVAVETVGERPLGDWECRQQRWVAKRGGQPVDERWGLVCKSGSHWSQMRGEL